MQIFVDWIKLHTRAIAFVALLLFSFSWVFSIRTVDPVNGPNLCHLIKIQKDNTHSIAALGSDNTGLAEDADHVDMNDKSYVASMLTLSSPFNARVSWPSFQSPSAVTRHYPLIDVPIV
jgi:hypothetical protein